MTDEEQTRLTTAFAAALKVALGAEDVRVKASMPTTRGPAGERVLAHARAAAEKLAGVAPGSDFSAERHAAQKEWVAHLAGESQAPKLHAEIADLNTRCDRLGDYGAALERRIMALEGKAPSSAPPPVLAGAIYVVEVGHYSALGVGDMISSIAGTWFVEESAAIAHAAKLADRLGSGARISREEDAGPWGSSTLTGATTAPQKIMTWRWTVADRERYVAVLKLTAGPEVPRP